MAQGSRKVGFSSETSQRVVLNSGIIYGNFDTEAFRCFVGDGDAAIAAATRSATNFGATDGGVSVDVTPEFITITCDGSRENTKGSQRLDGFTANLSATLCEVDQKFLLSHLTGTKATALENGFIEVTEDVSASCREEACFDIAVVADYGECVEKGCVPEIENAPACVVFVLCNALSTGGFSFQTQNQDKATFDISYTGQYDPDDCDKGNFAWYVPARQVETREVFTGELDKTIGIRGFFWSGNGVVANADGDALSAFTSFDPVTGLPAHPNVTDGSIGGLSSWQWTSTGTTRQGIIDGWVCFPPETDECIRVRRNPAGQEELAMFYGGSESSMNLLFNNGRIDTPAEYVIDRSELQQLCDGTYLMRMVWYIDRPDDVGQSINTSIQFDWLGTGYALMPNSFTSSVKPSFTVTSASENVPCGVTDFKGCKGFSPDKFAID